MEKLRLNVEELTVQSFATDDADAQMGTVQGQEVAAPSAFYTRCCQTNEVQSCPARCTP
ncbi:MAG TPA: pinensin family lanthipeptide [Longimicrobium sp.]|nr:pinensin family lanthipeptide [Longimicrobium sp.]